MAAALLIALAGCDTARTLEEGETNECGRCHGFPPDVTGSGRDHPVVAAPVEASKCSPCHSGSIDPSGATLAGHQNGTIETSGGHSAGYGDPAVHGPEALAFLAGVGSALECTSCHGTDYEGGTSGRSCNACHASAAGPSTSWTANCTFCHGTQTPDYTAVANPVAAAPPEGVAGQAASTDRHVGAHQAHLNAGPYAGPLACTSCHAVPDAAAALTHFAGDGSQATITFDETATKGVTGAAYAGAGGSCNVYCHGSGSELTGGQNPTPAWTSTGLACDACHGQPPASGPTFLAPNAHVFHVTTVGGCGACHESYTVSTVNAETHVNGAKEAIVGATRITGWDCATCHALVGVPAASHPVPYTSHPADALAGIGSCTSCHGTSYGDTTIAGATSCNTCHSAVAAGDWKTNCTFCHGARTPSYTSADLARAAPPEAVIDASDQTPANPKVGAHQAHLNPGTYANGFACATCHTVPPEPQALTHFAGGAATADIAFSALASQGVAAPAYAGAGGGCTVYCHGAGTTLVGANETPAWTATTLACNACHASRPTTGGNSGHQRSGHRDAPCTFCHKGYTQDTSVNLSIHVDGAKTVFFDNRGGTTTTLTNVGGAGGTWNCDACHTGADAGNANAPVF